MKIYLQNYEIFIDEYGRSYINFIGNPDEIAVKTSKIDEIIQRIELNKHHLKEQLSDAGFGLILNTLKDLENLKKG